MSSNHIKLQTDYNTKAYTELIACTQN